MKNQSQKDIEQSIMLLDEMRQYVRYGSPAHVHALDMAIEALENQVYISPMVRKYGRIQ